MSNKSISRDLTEGNLWTQLLIFSLPFMASNALQVLYSTIDMVIVGHFVGTAGLSAVSQASQIVNFAVMVMFGFSNAGQVLISQALGAGKKKEMSEIIGTLFVFMGVIALVLTAIIVCFCKPILTLIKLPEESYQMAVEYLLISGAGLIFTAGYNLVSSILRGMGDAKRPFIFIGIASVINLLLDLLFTGLWGWGVAGAAWATIIGQAVSFIFSIYYLYRRRESFGFDFRPESFKPNMRYLGMMSRLGVPMAVQSGFINVSMLFVSSLINEVGVVASATFGVGVRIDDIVNKISMGIQYAAMPMVSQCIGAGKVDRAKKTVWVAIAYSIMLTIIFMLLYIFFGKELFMMFSDDPLVHEMSHEFIMAILWMFPAFALMRGTGAFIQGIGNAKLGMILAILDGVVLRIGLSWLFGLGMNFGFFGFVLGYGLAPYGYAIPSLIYFLSGIWKKRKTLAGEL